MRALDRKLLRDLWHAKGQALAIAAVIAVGVSMLVAYLSTLRSLERAQQAYYRDYRFADVFASLKRAPLTVRSELAAIPGVALVETRVVSHAVLDVEGMDEPAQGRLISIPVPGGPALNGLHLRSGRLPDRGRSDEVVVNEGFASAHALRPGAQLGALINGRWRRLRVVGIALSPEYVYAIRPGEMVPDDRGFAVLWMEREALAAAGDFVGAFNDVALALEPGADNRPVLAAVDRVLARYGGLGAVPRALQMSHWSLTNEFAQLRGFGLVVPAIFVGIAVFLLHVVSARIVGAEREQIAALKAVGYDNLAVGLHYGKWSVVVSLGGAAIGCLGGIWMGAGITTMYRDYFRFPALAFAPAPDVMIGALALSVGAGLAGALGAVGRAVSLAPAEAMRPQAPARYRRSILERLGLASVLSSGLRMAVRHLERHPVRAITSLGGIALATATMVVGLFMYDAVEELIRVQFSVVQRQDITVTFVEPRPEAALHELERLAGVMAVEGTRAVPVRLRAGNRSRDVVLQGLPGQPRLQQVATAAGRAATMPADGLLLGTALARLLGVGPGDLVDVEMLDGRRRRQAVRVTRLADEYLGLGAYMRIEAVWRLAGEGPVLSGAHLLVDEAEQTGVYRALKARPRVAGVTLTGAALGHLRRMLDETMGVMMFINVLFAATVGFGVVYNAARISLAEQGRDLASLRVLGFTRQEAAQFLFSELAVLSALGIPLGLAVGYGLSVLVVTSFATELYRIPVVVSSGTFAAAVLVTLAATVASALIVRRALDRLSLVDVLKARE